MDIREFKNTYSAYAPSVVWDWCAKPTPEEIDTQLSDFSGMGIKSVYIRPSKGLILPYLSEDFFELVRTAARRAARYEITLWICDENSHSSGNGGGEITSVADYRMRDFVRVNKSDIEKTDEIITEDASSAIVLRDMSALRASKRAPLADITDAFVTQCFTEEVYDKYIRSCKRFIGCEIHGFLTHINFPENALPCSENALKNLGVNLADSAKKLTENDVNFKMEYFSAMSKASAENFTALLKDKCESNNLSLAVGVNGEGFVSRQLQYIKSDQISLETDTAAPDFLQIKLAESISAQFKKPLTARLRLPAYTECSARFNAAAFMSAMGADSICYDSVAFSLSDRRKYEDNTVVLSKFSEKDISDRVSRFCSITAQTFSAAKVLVIYTPDKKDIFSTLCESLIKRGISFHVAEKEVFDEYADISSDKISVGNCTYTTVICDASFRTDGFSGKRFTPDADLSKLNDGCFMLCCDNELYINRRIDKDDEYIFITATSGDSVITADTGDKKLFAADSSNGEIYEIPSVEGKYTFTLKSGKTVLLIYSGDIAADLMPPYTDEIQIIPSVKKCDIPFTLSSAGENIFPLKSVNACFGRKSYRENNIDNLHKEFYSLPDGETVKVKYPFTVDLEKIGSVRAYIENAGNLDFIELNGKTLEGFTPSDKDPRFMGADITEFLADGKNTLAVEYKKYNNYTPGYTSLTPPHFYSFTATSFEPVYLCGDFDTDGTKLTQLDEYTNDVSVSGMPYYCGALTYSAKLPESGLSGTLLTVHGSFDLCRIKIGKREITYYAEVPVMELFNLDCGTIAEITVFNTPYNLLRTTDKETQPFGIERIELCN